jgi:hypothetical protein
MKRVRRAAVVAVGTMLTVAVALVATNAHPAQLKSGWQAPFNPNKLEWLAVAANDAAHEHCHRTSPSDACITTSFAPQPPSTILVLVQTIGDPTHSQFEAEIASAKDVVRTIAAGMGVREPLNIEVKQIPSHDSVAQ